MELLPGYFAGNKTIPSLRTFSRLTMEVRDADGKVTTKASLLWARYCLEQVAVEEFLKASEGFMVILDGWKNPAHDHVAQCEAENTFH
eukprot:905163-Rhodomonas_salina.1